MARVRTWFRLICCALIAIVCDAQVVWATGAAAVATAAGSAAAGSAAAGSTAAGSTAAGSTTIDEPAALALLALGVTGLIVGRHVARRRD